MDKNMKLAQLILLLCMSVCVTCIVAQGPTSDEDTDSNGDLSADEIMESVTQEQLDAACSIAEATKTLEAQREKFFRVVGIDQIKGRGPSHYHAGFNRGTGRRTPARRWGGRLFQLALKAFVNTLKLNKKQQIAFVKRLGVSGHSVDFYVNLTCSNQNNINCDPRVRYRSANGSCNNLRNPGFGQAIRAFARFVPAAYQDVVGSPRVNGVEKLVNGVPVQKPLPSARLVSRTVHTNSDLSNEAPNVTHMLMQWAQFLDHDLTNTPQVFGDDGSEISCCEEDFMTRIDIEELRMNNVSEEEITRMVNLRDGCFPIDIPTGDRAFNRTCMNFVRSLPAPPTACKLAPREQQNDITAYHDASNVYGSSQEEQDGLRLGFNGLMLVTNISDPGLGNLLPLDTEEESPCVITSSDQICFRAGDLRRGEFPALTAMHTLWVREHNRIALELKKHNSWDDERIFQETRRIVGAFHQKITYGDFLPILLGPDLMKAHGLNIKSSHGYYQHFRGYDEREDATIRNSFATAAYRLGHTFIKASFSRVDENYNSVFEPLTTGNEFFRPDSIYDSSTNGPNSLIRGLLSDRLQNFDRLITSEVTERLFEARFNNSTGSLDLVALNIQRGRDHGLPSYMEFRKFCGLPTVCQFNSLPDHDAETRAKFAEVYHDVEDIDIFSGGISEKRLDGAQIGPTFGCLVAQQLNRLKRGDRFYFENYPTFRSTQWPDSHNRYYSRRSSTPVRGFNKCELKEIRKMTLSRAICDNVPVNTIQPNAFKTHTVIGNERVPCSQIPQPDLSVFDSLKMYHRHRYCKN